MNRLMRRIEKLKEEWPEIQVFSSGGNFDLIYDALDEVFIFCQMELDNPNEKAAKVFAQEVLYLVDKHLGCSEFNKKGDK